MRDHYIIISARILYPQILGNSGDVDGGQFTPPIYTSHTHKAMSCDIRTQTYVLLNRHGWGELAAFIVIQRASDYPNFRVDYGKTSGMILAIKSLRRCLLIAVSVRC